MIQQGEHMSKRIGFAFAVAVVGGLTVWPPTIAGLGAAGDYGTLTTVHEKFQKIRRPQVMDALDFDHRLVRPWSRDPGLYLDAFRRTPFLTCRCS